MNTNPMTNTDFYKIGHPSQYAKGTEFVFSNFTARSSARAVSLPQFIKDEVMLANLSGFIQEVLIEGYNKNFFNKPVDEAVARFKRRMDTSLGPDSVSTEHIRALHKLRYLPLIIQGVPEGTLVPVKVPMLVVMNTRPEFGWLVGHIETELSANIWQPCTSATTAFQYRCLLEQFALKTGSPLDVVKWQGHDFSYRGMPGTEAAARSGSGHLYSFLGTDTIPALDYLEEYYKGLDTFVGGSVPASEHAVASTNILALEAKYADTENPKLEAEKEFFLRYITEIYPSGIASYVSDTYDFWSVLTEVAPANKQAILGRKVNALGQAKVVFRPDSGDPVEILCGIEVPDADSVDDAVEQLVDAECEATAHGECGNSEVEGYFRIAGKVMKVSADLFWNRYDKQYYYHDGTDNVKAVEVDLTAEQKGAVEVLWDIFGGTETDKGYKLLNERVGLIYGDSITLKRAEAILSRLEAKGFASGNVVFGIGSFTYQYVTRDTHGFAMKCTYAIVDGEEIQVFKDPKTDDGTKKSAKGLINVFYDADGNLQMKDQMFADELVAHRKEGTAFIKYYEDGDFFTADIETIRTTVDRQVIAKIK